MKDYSEQNKKAWEYNAYEGIKVANICGSCGKRAIPLALLGSEVTIYDISEDNRIMKIAFVGVGKKEQKPFERIREESGVMVSYLNDYEKAKEWILK